MHSYDVKIFELIDILKALGKITYESDFCTAIGIKKQNIAPIRKGLAHFKAKHIQNICEVYGVNANWIFGYDQKNVFLRVTKTVTKK